MNRTLSTTLLLAFLLLLLIAPFSALAPLVLIVFTSAICLIGLSLLRTLIMGSQQSD